MQLAPAALLREDKMKKIIPIRPYYVNKPFKFFGVAFNTDDVFPPQEMQCPAHRLIALANGRHLVVAKVVSDADYEKAKERVERELAARDTENKKETRHEADRRQKQGNEEPAPVVTAGEHVAPAEKPDEEPTPPKKTTRRRT